MRVFVCVRKVTFDQKTTVLKPVDISVGTIPRLIIRTFPTEIKNPSLLKCKGVWTCHPTPGFDDNFLISLVRGKKSLASVVIPLSWLPKDQVVQTWFPLKLQNHKTWKHAPMALISLHLDTLGQKRFNAPRGNLTVIPGWKMPQTKNCKQQKPKQQVIMNNGSQQMILPPQQIQQPLFYGYSQYPVQYVQNPQYVPYQQQNSQPISPQFQQPQYQPQLKVQPQQAQTSLQFQQPLFQPLPQNQQPLYQPPPQVQQPLYQPPLQVQQPLYQLPPQIQQLQSPQIIPKCKAQMHPQYPVLNDNDIPKVNYPSF